MNFTRLPNAIVVCLLCVSFAASQSTNENRPRLTNKEVLELVKAEVSSDVIVAKIKVSRCNFDTDPTVLSELKHNGVSNEVLKAMIEAPYGSPKIEKPPEKVTSTETVTSTKTMPKPAPEVEVEDKAKTDRWHGLILDQSTPEQAIRLFGPPKKDRMGGLRTYPLNRVIIP